MAELQQIANPLRKDLRHSSRTMQGNRAMPIKEIEIGASHHFDPELAACFLDIRPKILEIKDHW